jgi:hypothetical protein
VQRLAILDKSRTAYDHEIIVMPNFGSTDYLYGKVALLNANQRKRQLVLQKIGFDSGIKLRNIEVTQSLTSINLWVTMSNV